MDCRIIKSPGEGTLAILNRRKGSGPRETIERIDAVGLVQGKLIEMICASDVAEKAVGVTVEDIRGSCPQNMIMLAIFGDTASVTAAIEEIKNKEKKEIDLTNNNFYYSNIEEKICEKIKKMRYIINVRRLMAYIYLK